MIMQVNMAVQVSAECAGKRCLCTWVTVVHVRDNSALREDSAGE
jgi:hypothetical protein